MRWKSTENVAAMSDEFSRRRYLFYLCGDQSKASSRVRGYWIAEELEENGATCRREPRHTGAALLLFALQIPFHDIVIFQKSYSRWHCLLARWARMCRKITILDLDDAPSRTNHPVTLRNVEFMMRNVSAVTVGSRVLRDYASRFSDNVHLVPSSIRLKYYQPVERKRDQGVPICLGWIGNGAHYKADLISLLREPLTEVAKKHPLRLKLIGACGEGALYDAFGDIAGLEMDFIDQIEWSAPTAAAEALSHVDIGLYPLLPGGSNDYKCGFKALEYMAMKIPVISSNVAENREIVENGVTGVFVDTPDGWQKAIETLIEDDKLRERMGEAGRARVENKFTVSRTAQALQGIPSP